MTFRVAKVIQQRPLWIVGMALGFVVFTALFLRTEDTRDRIIKVENDSPCTGLTTRQCANRIVGALDEQDLIEIRKRFIKLRQDRSRGGPMAAGGSPGGSRSKRPGISPPGLGNDRLETPGLSQPNRGGQNNEGNGQNPKPPPSGSDPDKPPSSEPPPPSPTNLIDPPTIDIPIIGPIDLPAIECPELPLTEC